MLADSLANPPGLSDEVRICGAQHNARVLKVAGFVQSEKISAILSQQGPTGRSREFKNFFVTDSSICLARFERSLNVVAQCPELANHLEREILIRIKLCHRTRRR